MAKRAQENNRIPLLVLGVLVVTAIIWRIANPTPPIPPGPIAMFPGWRSTHTYGELASHAVNPAGTLWAGVWNDDSKGKERSGVWVIDFENYDAQPCLLSDGPAATSITWVDDKTLRVVRPKADDALVYVNAQTLKVERSAKLKTPVERVIDWPVKSDKFLAQLAGEGKNIKLAVLSESGELLGKEVPFELPKNGALYTDAGMSPDGNEFVFSVLDDAAGGGRAYYLGDTQLGAARHMFDLKDLPGRVDGMSISSAGILIACSDRDKFQTLIYDPIASKLNVMPDGAGADMANKWPDASKSLAFVTYNGAYDFDPASGKAKRLFEFANSNSSDSYWRQGVQGGRVYPLKNGNYIAVGTPGRYVDILEMSKTGAFVRNLLPR